MNRNSRINRFIKKMLERGITIAMAESMTCGLAAHLLSTCKGTSEVLRGSVVCYHESVKKDLLGVKAGTIKKYSAESGQVTEALARGLKKTINADLHAAITGLASAGGSEGPGKPVGSVFFCLIWRGRTVSVKKVFRGTPLEIREKACLHLYDLILDLVSRPPH